MKNLLIAIIAMFLYAEVDAQLINDADEYFPFQDELAAIKKGDKWGFINKKGELVINFRDDIVVSNENPSVTNEFIAAKPYRGLILWPILILADGKEQGGDCREIAPR